MSWFLSRLYGLAVGIRASLYNRGVLKKQRLAHPVISVGNLTVGGTGKTPFVAFLAEMLQKAGRRPAILSRGYKGSAENSILLVSDGSKPLCDPKECGDEPYLLARRLKGVPVAVGRKRYRAGRLVEERFGQVIHILDDGYQHLSLERNLDILILDATDPFGGFELLPKGRLREPLQALGRAQLIVITRSQFAFDEEELETTVRRHNKKAPIWYFYHDATSLYDLKTGQSHSLRDFFGKRVIALAALGNPMVFLRDLAHYQIRVTEEFLFRDHHAFTQTEVDGVLRSLTRAGAAAVVTTEKDAVRLERLRFGEGQIFVFQIEPKAENPEEYKKYLLDEIDAFTPIV